MILPAPATRNVLFTGKGGVGKTSIACATALSLADAGKKVLLVSTDPASNLAEVLEAEVGITPKHIQRTDSLLAVNIDPEKAAHEYKERVVGPYRELLPQSAIQDIEEQLSGACTLEIAAFDEFAKLLGAPATTSSFDHVIFDTAPTGHTLRLLELPAAWTGLFEANSSGTSCLGPLAGLTAQREMYVGALSALRDESRTSIFLVSRPERTSLVEANRTKNELEALGIKNQSLVINGIFEARSPEDPIASALQQCGRDALGAMPAELHKLNRIDIPLVPFPLIGVDGLRRFANGEAKSSHQLASVTLGQPPTPLNSLIPELARPGKGVIMTMGKGGVGKTTIAGEIAVELAWMGHSVHLTTTDPAAHILTAVERHLPTLHISRIDPVAEAEKYRAEVLTETGKFLDHKGQALLEEDLRSPCTQEIAVFRAFARTVDEGNQGFVVIDTAPTGHTLLLLDAACSYHREMERKLAHIPDAVSRLLPQLRDRDFTRILIVTLAEATPVHEAAQLQHDLERAGIHPFAWVINQSFLAAGTADPFLAERSHIEARYIDEVRSRHAKRTVLIPWTSSRRSRADLSAELVHAGVKL